MRPIVFHHSISQHVTLIGWIGAGSFWRSFASPDRVVDLPNPCNKTFINYEEVDNNKWNPLICRHHPKPTADYSTQSSHPGPFL